MFELINRDRVANHLRPVAADSRLSAAAEDAPYTGCGFPVAGRAKDMGERNYLSHSIKGCGNQGVSHVVNSIVGLVVSGTGENIAWMNGTADPLVAAENLQSQLMSSPGHRSNILNGNFTKVGIGSWHTAPGQTWSGAGAAGWLAAFPTGDALPLASNLNFGPGQSVPNLVVAKLGANGQVSVYNAVGTTHVIADVAGWYDTE